MKNLHLRILIACFVVVGWVSGCNPQEITPELEVQVPEGYEVEVFVEGLNRPTQMIIGPEGEVWVAQLAGNENDGAGQVVALSEDGTPRVVLEGLYKPTGLAWIGDSLWIASGRDLLRVPLNEGFEAGEPEVVFAELAYNGRSNGTLTVTPDQQLIFETSGRRAGNVAAEGSATLWQLDPANPIQLLVLATGLKNAYAHTFEADGTIWITEIADDPVNDGPPPDELNMVPVGLVPDFGWPQCFGEQQPARNYEGTAAICQETRPSVTTFAPHTTPTSVVLSPWERDTLLVALWGPIDPSVVRIKIARVGDHAVAQEVSPFLTGLHPQHLLVLPDGSLLVSDSEEGVVYRVMQKFRLTLDKKLNKTSTLD